VGERESRTQPRRALHWQVAHLHRRQVCSAGLLEPAPDRPGQEPATSGRDPRDQV
jgi:hypothetical protein